MLAAFLQSKKEKLLALPTYSGDSSRRAQGKRLAHSYRTAILRSLTAHGPRRQPIRSPQLLLYKVRADYLRDVLCPNFAKNWRNISQRLKRRRRDRIQLENLSFARNPTGTLRQLRKLVEKAAVSVDLRVDFCDPRCDDVAPYIILAHLMRALPPVFSGGTISLEVAAVLEAVGLDRALGIRHIASSRHRETRVLPFPMMQRAPPGFFGDKDHQLRPQYKEYVADRFCNALEGWLDTHDIELTPEAAESLINSITEALDNAERHGAAEVDGGMGDWSMAGFSRLIVTEEAETSLECSVAIVSVGSTISASLETAATDIRNRIDAYVSSNLGPRFVEGRGRRKLLRTVMALQDGVTRVSAASQASRGGVGLMTLVNLFGDLGETDKETLQSVFTILSGSSCLRITSPYRRGLPAEGSTLRELWFNERNDPAEPPSATHAFAIADDFAGTVLSAYFTIDPGFLRQKFSG